MPKFDFIELLLTIPAALIALSVHEYAHGYAAYRLGDPTARSLGRLTLNPLKHLDPIGTLCMLLFRFGWANPVPINPRYFKNPRKGMAITAAAGPLANLLLAFIGALIAKLVELLGDAVLPLVSSEIFFFFFLYLELFFLLFHYLNLSLCVFNLIPLPPLDGSRIFFVFLPPKWYFKVMKYERIIQIVLLVALWLGAFSGILSFIVDKLSSAIFFILSFIPS
ncbi:MAG: site-2 protease family protein [Clostridia bacterium]|nr:site-2 protease family protein [Clostridia bacterium]